MKTTRKPFIVIRRSGYYINTLINHPMIIKLWMEENLTRTDPKGKPNKSGVRPQRTLAKSMRACCVTFTPTDAADMARIPVFVPSLARRYGVLKV